MWADGIDPDGCQDVRISNCTIETGDDALVFYSSEIWGPALPVENVTVTNCRLSSSSSAIKFCDGNSNAVRRVAIDNIVITNSNRGLAFMVFDGGVVEDVVISNVTIDTRRFDWFWWGDGDPIHFNIKRRSEVDGVKRAKEPPAGAIRNVTLRNVIAHGRGTSALNGHPDSWLDGIRLENIRLFVSHDPQAPYEDTQAALTLRDARNFTMKDVEIRWEMPKSEAWKDGLHVENVADVLLDGVDAPTRMTLKDIDSVTVRHSRTPALHVSGARSHNIRLRDVEGKVATDSDVPRGAVTQQSTIKGYPSCSPKIWCPPFVETHHVQGSSHDTSIRPSCDGSSSPARKRTSRRARTTVRGGRFGARCGKRLNRTVPPGDSACGALAALGALRRIVGCYGIEDYVRSVADAAVAGARWIISLDETCGSSCSPRIPGRSLRGTGCRSICVSARRPRASRTTRSQAPRLILWSL